MADFTLLHNQNCSTSRAAIQAADDAGVEVAVVHYLKEPLDEAALLDLLGKLEDPPANLVRRDAHFTELGLSDADLADAAKVAALLARHPKLMQRPVLIKGDHAIIGRPKSRVPAFLRY